MPSEKKIEQVKNLTEELKKAKSVVLVNYQGLTHQQLADLRNKLKEVNGSLMITKNTLLRLALGNQAGLPREIIEGDFLRGPTAALFITSDPIPTLKALHRFSTEFDLPKIKIGILEGEIAEKEKILRLATLPSKEILIAQVVWGLKTPSQRLTFALNWNLQKLTLVLKRMSEKN